MILLQQTPHQLPSPPAKKRACSAASPGRSLTYHRDQQVVFLTGQLTQSSSLCQLKPDICQLLPHPLTSRLAPALSPIHLLPTSPAPLLSMGSSEYSIASQQALLL